MGSSLNACAALVSFSGGQDSTTALAWALSQYEVVETIGFRYGQKHLAEMKCRPVVRHSIAEMNPTWKARLGPDHVIELDLIGQIAKNIASPAGYTPIPGEGFEAGSRYIPGRNLVMLSMCVSVAFRRNIANLVCGTSETEYSGYPDCRDASMKAAEAAINMSSGKEFKIKCPLMWLDKKGVWQLAESLGGPSLIRVVQEETHTCYQGTRDTQHEWGYGCGSCPACQLRAKGWREFRAH
jgi:7-cyano-7-deazaguanine synthase